MSWHGVGCAGRATHTTTPPTAHAAHDTAPRVRACIPGRGGWKGVCVGTMQECWVQASRVNQRSARQIRCFEGDQRSSMPVPFGFLGGLAWRTHTQKGRSSTRKKWPKRCLHLLLWLWVWHRLFVLGNSVIPSFCGAYTAPKRGGPKQKTCGLLEMFFLRLLLLSFLFACSRGQGQCPRPRCPSVITCCRPPLVIPQS